MPYRILVLDRNIPATTGLAAALRAAVDAQLKLYNLSTATIDWPASASQLSGPHPAAAVFIGGPAANTAVDDEAEIVLRKRLFLMPVMPPGARPAVFLPSPVSDVLAEEQSAGWEERVATRLLEELGLGTGVPRVFISYFQRDSIRIARQLQDGLAQSGISVFLDTHVLRRGSVLPLDIHDEIVRSDLLVQLRSPNVALSSWVDKETALAKRAGVGVLSLLWPSQSPVPGLITHALVPNDFTSPDELEPGTVGVIVLRVHEQRLRAFALRRARMQQRILSEALSVRFPAYIDTKTPAVIIKRRRRLEQVVALVGTPSSNDLQAVTHRHRQGRKRPRLCLDEMAQPRSSAHWKWLAAYLPIRLNSLDQLHRTWTSKRRVKKRTP